MKTDDLVKEGGLRERERVPWGEKLSLEAKRAKNRKYYWNKKAKAKKEEERRLKLEGRRDGGGDWGELLERVREETLGKDVKPSILTLYKDMLKYEKEVERQGKGGKGLSGDEIAQRNIEAERGLREGGYLGVELT